MIRGLRKGLALVAASACVAGGGTALAAQSASAAVYWPENGTLGAANLDGSNPNLRYLLFRQMSGPTCDVAVDATHLYWCEWFGLWRVNLEGPATPTQVVPGLDNPGGIAVDASHLYWANTGGDAIGRSAPDGSAREDTFIAGLHRPCDVVVDGHTVYWIDGRGIGRANLDGSEVEPNFLPLPPGGCGLAVDSQYLYWANDRAIGRLSLDGSFLQPDFIAGLDHVAGIAVDSGHVYWMNVPEGMSYATIGRAGIDGGEVTKSWIPTQKFNAYGVAVDARPSPPPLPLPSRPIYIGKLRHSLKDGSAVLAISVPERGELTVTSPRIGWKLNKGPEPPPYRYGSFLWRLKLWLGKTRFGKKIRKRLHNKGRALLNLRITYTEEGQLPLVTKKRLALLQHSEVKP